MSILALMGVMTSISAEELEPVPDPNDWVERDSTLRDAWYNVKHHGKDVYVHLMLRHNAPLQAYKYGQLKYWGPDLPHEKDGGVFEADDIKVVEFKLWHNGNLQEVCDQTSSVPDHNDGSGCVNGEEGNNGPCKIFVNIQDAPYANPGCDETSLSTKYVQTGQHYHIGDGGTWRLRVEFYMRWHTQVESDLKIIDKTWNI
jgi:hypothetical protein